MPKSTAHDHYEGIATAYDGMEALPQTDLTRALVKYGLGDCTSKIILDIGGGTGIHARCAVELGAERVDNVDLSPDMLQRCESAEIRAGRKPGDRVQCFTGDAFQSFDHLDLPGRDGNGLYDIIMVIWTMDHASSVQDVEGIWHNIAKYCQPGGKLVLLHVTNPFNVRSGTSFYGVKITDLKAVPGGAEYIYHPQTDPPFSCKAIVSEAVYDDELSNEVARRFGFDELEVVPAVDLPVVKREPEYWQDYLESPGFVCVVGVKKKH